MMRTPDESSPDKRPRILHILKWLPRGGIETWLVHVFRVSAEGPYRHEIVLMQDEIGPYEAAVRAADVIIHTLPMTKKAAWFFDLYRFLKREGPFDVVHAHVDPIVSGPALVAAALAGVPVRIIHNHSARSEGVDGRTLPRRIRRSVGRAVSMRASTHALGISEMAMADLAGKDWRRRDDCRILLYGFDYSGFHGAADRTQALRTALDIPLSARVVGHVGRFDPVKNHGFLLDCFAKLHNGQPDAILVLIGRGPLEETCRQQAARLGIADHVRFAGGTDDIPAFMAMFDIFVLTSFSEGLGIVLLEAQAGGCPVLMPDNMPHEVVVVGEGVTLLSLDAGVDRWATAMTDILSRPRPDADEWLQKVENSAFGMSRCVSELEAFYEGALASTR